MTILKCKVTKLRDKDGKKSDTIQPGEFRVGQFIQHPITDMPFYLRTGQISMFVTSSVQKILSQNTFETKNSAYKYEIYE